MTAAQTGRLAEALALEILTARGYRLLERNFSTPRGEIDLILEQGDCIVFVEVRARRRGSLVSPVETITPAKRKKIIAAAYEYLERHPGELQPRFDAFLVETAGEEPARWRWEHLPGAFDTTE